MKAIIHPTSEVSPSAHLGAGTRIWNFSQIRENVRVGKNCNIGKNVYIDTDVIIGDNCKIQNNASLYLGSVIEDGVFIGPHVVLTNDKNPRAINEDGSAKTISDWVVGKILIKKGASIGAMSVILPNVIIGRYAMIGSGSVVTKSVPDFALVYGNPGRIHGKVDKRGYILK